MDKKLTDKEIIKDLECCANCEDCFYGITNCSLGEEVECRSLLAQNTLDLINRQQAELDNLKVKNQSLRSAANSLKMHYEEAQAEVERLKRELDLVIENSISARYPHCVLCGNGAILTKSLEEYDELIADISAEAYKEFAERLKTEYAKGMSWFKKKESYYVDVGDIDNLAKEMVGENNE